MNVASINFSNYGGGAEKVSNQIYSELNRKNINSYFLVGNKYGAHNDEKIVKITKCLNDRIYSKILRECMSLQGIFGNGTIKYIDNFFSKNNIDIVHYHNLHGNYINLKVVDTISRKRNIPAVLTLHDMWAFTGRCAYSYDCDEWQRKCGKCNEKLKNYPKMNFDNSRHVLEVKKKYFNKNNIHVVTPSKWMEKLARKSFMKDMDIRTIYNGVDLRVFKFNDKFDLRKKYNLDQDKKYVLFISADNNDERKGFKYIINSLKNLEGRKNIVLLVVGKSFNTNLLNNKFEIHEFGYIKDESKINDIYSLADVFVMPTLSDNFPCTIIEAMASGTPVISFDVGGINEQITNEVGWLVKPKDERGLTNSIENALNMDLRSMSYNARKRVEQKFSLDDCIDNYINLYYEILRV